MFPRCAEHSDQTRSYKITLGEAYAQANQDIILSRKQTLKEKYRNVKSRFLNIFAHLR